MYHSPHIHLRTFNESLSRFLDGVSLVASSFQKKTISGRFLCNRLWQLILILWHLFSCFFSFARYLRILGRPNGYEGIRFSFPLSSQHFCCDLFLHVLSYHEHFGITTHTKHLSQMVIILSPLTFVAWGHFIRCSFRLPEKIVLGVVHRTSSRILFRDAASGTIVKNLVAVKWVIWFHPVIQDCTVSYRKPTHRDFATLAHPSLFY